MGPKTCTRGRTDWHPAMLFSEVSGDTMSYQHKFPLALKVALWWWQFVLAWVQWISILRPLQISAYLPFHDFISILCSQMSTIIFLLRLLDELTRPNIGDMGHDMSMRKSLGLSELLLTCTNKSYTCIQQNTNLQHEESILNVLMS